jgi:NAD(P)H-flavin reductase
LIVKLGKIVKVEPEIEEIEINPVIVTLNDVWAVDNKVILKQTKQMPEGPKFKTATTLSTELLSGKMHYFEFKTAEPFDIKPGQYISVKVSDTRINCYSIAGHTSPTKFDLLVDSTPGGSGSKFFEQLKTGDRITFLGPFGTFILKQEDTVKNMLFLGTGCGVAPLKYMIETVLSDSKFKQVIKLYIGVLNFEDIFLQGYFKKLSEEYKNFSFEIAVNNPNPLWKGPTGFITELVKHDFPDASKCSAYLCGNKFMVQDVTKLLTDNGCPDERIYVEKI